MAGFKVATKKIGTKTFEVTQLAAKEGRPLLWKLGQIMAPMLDALGKGKNGAAKAAMATTAIQALLSGVSYSIVEEFAEAIGANTKCTSEEGISIKLNTAQLRDTAFGTRYLDYFEWLAFGLEVNFADFFGDLLTRMSSRVVEETKSQ